MMHDPSRRYVKAAGLSLLFLLLLFASLKTPLMLLYPLILPITFFIDGLDHRFPARFFFVLMTFFLSIIFFGTSGLMLTIYALASGYTLSYLLKKKGSALESLGILFLALLVLNVFLVFGTLSLLGISFEDWTETVLQPLDEEMGAIWPEGAGTFHTFASNLVRYTPYMLTLYSFVEATLLYVVYEKIARRLRGIQKPLPPLATLSFSPWLIWLYFLLALLTFTKEDTALTSLDTQVIENMFLIISTMLMMQGIFFVYRLSEESKARLFWRSLAVIGLIIPPFDLLLRLIGLFDLVTRHARKPS